MATTEQAATLPGTTTGAGPLVSGRTTRAWKLPSSVWMVRLSAMVVFLAAGSPDHDARTAAGLERCGLARAASRPIGSSAHEKGPLPGAAGLMWCRLSDSN